jgi:hypothetical protein
MITLVLAPTAVMTMLLAGVALFALALLFNQGLLGLGL